MTTFDRHLSPGACSAVPTPPAGQDPVAALFALALEGGAPGEDAEYELGALAFPAVLGRPGLGDPRAAEALLALRADYERGQREGWPQVPAATLARADQRHARLRSTGR